MSEDAIDRGIYLAADTPRAFIPLALEDGSGDKRLLAEALVGILSGDELAELIDRCDTDTEQGGER